MVIVQSNMLNCSGRTTVICPISSKKPRPDFKTHIPVAEGEGNLIKPSVVIVEQIRVIDSSRLYKKIGKLTEGKMDEIMKAIAFLLSATPQ